MAPLAGLQGIAGSITYDPQASAEQRLGGPADPRHGQPYAVPPAQYPWEVLTGVAPPQQYGDQAPLAGSTDWAQPAGSSDQHPFFDGTPNTHAAPWPKGVEQSVQPDAVARQLEQSVAIHATDMGGSRRMHTTVAALQDRWSDFWTVDHGSSLQDANMPGQLKAAAGGYGTTDRVSSFARQNGFGFDSVHMHRRFAIGSVPGNYLWMKPGGRPMRKSQAGPARPPVGQASPFTGQDLTRDFGVQGAVLQDVATEYTAPPEPYLAPSYGPSPDPGPVSWW